MGGQLAPDDVVGGVGIGSLADLQEVDEHAAPLDVGEELVAESGALGGPLDQAGDVGQDQLPLAVVDRAEDRLERRERIVGHLRRGPRDSREQRRLAGVRQPDQAGIGQQAKSQLDPARLAVEAVLGEARSLSGRRGESLVPVAAETTGGDGRALPGLDQVEELPLQTFDGRPRRHEDDEVVAPRAVFVGPLPVTAARRAVMSRDPHRGEIAPRRIAEQDHVAAVAAVAAVGPAARDVRLAAEADDAVAAPTALDEYACAIVEHAG